MFCNILGSAVAKSPLKLKGVLQFIYQMVAFSRVDMKYSAAASTIALEVILPLPKTFLQEANMLFSL